MHTGCGVASSEFQDIPISSSRKSMDPLTLKHAVAGTSKMLKKNKDAQGNWDYLGNYKMAVLAFVITMTILLSFLISLLYLFYTSGDTFHPNERAGVFEKEERTVDEKPYLNEYHVEESYKNPTLEIGEHLNDQLLAEIRQHVLMMLPEPETRRIKREPPFSPSLCQQKTQQCDALLKEMHNLIPTINAMITKSPNLPNALLDNSKSSKLLGLIDCLRCNQFETEESEEDYEKPQQPQNNVGFVMKLLEDGATESEKKNTQGLSTEEPGPKSGNETRVADERPEVPGANTTIGNDGTKVDLDDGGSAVPSSADVEKRKQKIPLVEEGKGEGEGDGKGEVRGKGLADEGGTTDSSRLPGAANAKNLSVVLDARTKVEGSSNVTEMTNVDSVKEPGSEHPSNDSHAEDRSDLRDETSPENGNDAKGGKGYSQGLSFACPCLPVATTTMSDGVRQADIRRPIIMSRLHSKEELQKKDSMIDPTAETTKTGQQVQYTPPMSFYPYPMCFYGNPNSGQAKQIAPNPYGYPMSSPVQYPISTQQQRGGVGVGVGVGVGGGSGGGTGVSGGSPYLHSGQPNFVQVQTQSVQFMPPFSGSSSGQFGPGANQRMGPSGPMAGHGFSNPGYVQSVPTAPGTSSGRTPYYCTYFPFPMAPPTFQFPTVPGITDYQRSAEIQQQQEEEEQKQRKAHFESNKFGPQAKAIAYSGLNRRCRYNQQRCTDGSACIMKSKWCDGQVDCLDVSDETNCSCKNRLLKERHCDGYFDCPHGEDELGCHGCPVNYFSCEDKPTNNKKNCLPLYQRCDGEINCPNGKDEMDCSMLSSSYTEGRNAIIVGYTEGYLHKNIEGQWYPVCKTDKSWIVDACFSETGFASMENPVVKYYPIKENLYEGLYVVAEKDGSMTFTDSCDGFALYAICPEFPCGTTILPRDGLFTSGSAFRDSPLDSTMDEENFISDNIENSIVAYKNLLGMMQELHSRSKNQTDEIVGVVGGRSSAPKAWPFLVAIYKDGNFHCGGAILNKNWILTAAHCLRGYPSHYFEIHAGILRRFSFSPTTQTRKAEYVVIHPSFDKDLMKNDVGLIFLNEPLLFNRWVRPVCLPEAQTASPPPKSSCIAIGWGSVTEHGPIPDHLREVEVPILDNCKHPTDQNEAEFCAGMPQGGRDACQGDSGGPLMCRSPNSKSQWYIGGIVSHGQGCGRPHEPGAYTKVSQFVEWIRSFMRDSERSAISTADGERSGISGMPLGYCPGFRCQDGLGKCLPSSQRCDYVVDCLNAEDELNCSVYDDYSIYRNSDNQSELIAATAVGRNDTPRVPQEVSDDATLISENNLNGPWTSLEVGDSTNSTGQEATPLKDEFSNESSSTEPGEATTELESTKSTDPTTKKNPKRKAFFICKTLLQSIPYGKRCNRVLNCEDGTDEENCTCKDFLYNSRPDAICDGFVDCHDGSDEEDCEICQKDEFLCKRSKTCIPSWKRCDQEYDCPLKEDEEDCFALTNGVAINIDKDDRPTLNIGGVLTRYKDREWQIACFLEKSMNASVMTMIGRHICNYLGFANVKSAKSISTRETQVSPVSWRKDAVSRYEIAPTSVAPSERYETCLGLHIRCRPVLSSELDAHLVVDPATGSRTYLWPWLAAIFVDGHYRCTAILLEQAWLLSSSKCTENINLSVNYTTALLGHSPSYMFVDGPHQQISIIDEVRAIKSSNSTLLHLKQPVNMTRYVQPLFIEKKFYPPSKNDSCVAVGTGTDYQTEIIFLQPILKNCLKCYRCYVNNNLVECGENQTLTDWSGTVVCRGRRGWYPAAVFHEENGTCAFQKMQTLTSIDYINANLLQALEEEAYPEPEASCQGFRCALGECISSNRICDGVRDCRDGADEEENYCNNNVQSHCQNSVEGCACKQSELRCGNGKCVPKSAFCDLQLDCEDGTDEPSNCTCVEYLKLTAPERICDGTRHCFDKSDESPGLCFCKDDMFRCNSGTMNETCISMDFVCDDVKDCVGGEDEANCMKVNGAPDDPPGTGELQRRSFGVWHTECFSTEGTDEEAADLCRKLGYQGGSQLNDTSKLQPIMVPYQDEFYIVRLNQRNWVTLRNDNPLMMLGPPQQSCYRRILRCV